jgi:hypothetical protein
VTVVPEMVVLKRVVILMPFVSVVQSIVVEHVAVS